MKLHYKKKLKYLNAVADYLISQGYQVEEPTHEHDLLDVWGTHNGRKCFQEIYAFMYECKLNDGHTGINGVWHQGEHDGIEVFLHPDPLHGLDTRESLEIILDGLKPFKKGKRK